MEKPTKILIADAHPVVLVGIRKALKDDGAFEVVGEATGWPELLPLVGRTAPEVVLVDRSLLGLDGLDGLERLRSRRPDVKIVMLASEADPAGVSEAFSRGVCGFIVKTIEVDDLGPSIHAALDGGLYRPSGLPAMTDALAAKLAGLSRREFDILGEVARGLSNRDIAHHLSVSEPTVKFHLTSMYRKLGVRNRTAAARWAYANGIGPK
jgi:DNA-binding NarL/FixJ family response regulator